MRPPCGRQLVSTAPASPGALSARSGWRLRSSARRFAPCQHLGHQQEAEVLKARAAGPTRADKRKPEAGACEQAASGGLLFRELALLGDESVEPGEARVAAGLVPKGARGVDVPVEGLAVVAEASVQLAHQVGGDGELAPVEVLFPQSADEVAEGAQLEGALEGVLALLAADPRGAEAEVAQLAEAQTSLLAADLGGVEGEPRRWAGPEDPEEAVLPQALLDVVALVEGQVEVGEVLAGGEGARRAHGYGVPDLARPVRLAPRELGTQVGLSPDGDVAAGVRRPEDVATQRAPGADAPKLPHGRPSRRAGCP